MFVGILTTIFGLFCICACHGIAQNKGAKGAQKNSFEIWVLAVEDLRHSVSQVVVDTKYSISVKWIAI